jgi:cytochrome b
MVHVNVSTSYFLFMVYLANQITTGWLARKDHQIANRSVSFSSVEQKITHFHQKISNLQADFLNTSCASVFFYVDGKRNIWNGHGYRQSH